jgi:hypothetical protein
LFRQMTADQRQFFLVERLEHSHLRELIDFLD